VFDVTVDFNGNIVAKSLLVSIGQEVIEMGMADTFDRTKFVFPFRDSRANDVSGENCCKGQPYLNPLGNA